MAVIFRAHQPPNDEKPPFWLGDKVSHPKFGKGIIIKKLGREVFRVEFENHGTKDIHYIYLSSV